MMEAKVSIETINSWFDEDYSKFMDFRTIGSLVEKVSSSSTLLDIAKKGCI
jgi:hypothetical protein